MHEECYTGVGREKRKRILQGSTLTYEDTSLEWIDIDEHSFEKIAPTQSIAAFKVGHSVCTVC